MAPKQTTSSHKKSVASASKPWKEEIRRACLLRFRTSRFCTPEKTLGSGRTISSVQSFEELQLRHVIEDEMRRNGVILDSPCSDSCSADAKRVTFEPMEALADDGRSIDIPKANHYITEDELFDLLEEIEEEIQRERSNGFEEMIDIARQDLEDQVADFELWQESKLRQDDNATGSFLCPVCRDAHLMITSSGSLVCPNHMDGSCSMNLRGLHGHTLMDVQDRLREAFENHSAQCSKILCVSMVDTGNQANLVGFCDYCLAEFPIL